MDDLVVARDTFRSGAVSLVAVRDGRILGSSSAGGVRPLLQLVLQLGDELRGAALADKVVGRASALLCRHAGIDAVYAPVLSEAARHELDLAGIQMEADRIVPRILNRTGDNLCPFEQLTDGLAPGEALTALRRFFTL